MPLITLHKNTTSVKARVAQKAHRQKKEILEWLSGENPTAIELLKRVSECATPYTKLLIMTCEELQHVLGPVRSEKLDDLERDSSLNCAKLEVDIQQQREKIVKIKSEATELAKELRNEKKTLETLNFEIERLQKLHSFQESDEQESQEQPEKKSELREWDESCEEIKLDEEKYRELWMEQQQILDVLQLLEDSLKEKQEEQMKEMRKYVERKRKRFL